jgi:hypothetical protein
VGRHVRATLQGADEVQHLSLPPLLSALWLSLLSTLQRLSWLPSLLLLTMLLLQPP